MKNGCQAPLSTSASPESVTRDRPVHPLDWATQAGAVDDVLDEVNLLLRRRRRSRMHQMVASALVLCGVLITWQIISPSHAPVRQVPSLSPLVVRPTQQILPDGSVVEFRGGAQITVAFTDALRRIDLVSGEAHFQVTKDSARPFVVSARGVEFQAVGTAFTVHLASTKVEMFVTEGQVAVTAPEAEPTARPPDGREIVVDAGNQVIVDISVPFGAAPAVTAISPSALSQRLAWRAPRLELSGTPLNDVIALINTHATGERRTPIRLGDPSLAAIRISGILRADNIDTLIGVLEAEYGIKAGKRGNMEIVLHRTQ